MTITQLLTALVAASTPLLTSAALTNGATWHDTGGNQIEAHGGGVLKVGSVFHWYGSTKKELSYHGKHCLFECSLGVNLYTSRDLLAWDFQGLVFNHTQIVVPAAGLPGGNAPVLPFRIERPKVIYNSATKKFVLVFHCEDAPYRVGLRGVATSATPTGPFIWSHAENVSAPPCLSHTTRTMIHMALALLQPNGLFSMDMTEFVDPNDPSTPPMAYHIRTARHNPSKFHGQNTQWTVGSKLSSDYLTTAQGPICFNASVSAEGPAMLYHDGAYHLFASHLSGLAANPARLLRCKAKVLSDCCTSSEEPSKWEDLGNPAIGPATTPEGEGPSTTFNAQSTFVLPLDGTTAAAAAAATASSSPSSDAAAAARNVVGLWMGDRWHPDPEVDPGGEHNASYVWLNLVAPVAVAQPTTALPARTIRSTEEQPQQLCAPTTGVSCGGGQDLVPLKTAPKVATAGACCELCQSKAFGANCTAWTWNGPSGNHLCYPKTACTRTTRNLHAMSGSARLLPPPSVGPRPPPPAAANHPDITFSWETTIVPGKLPPSDGAGGSGVTNRAH